jgi:phosphoribosylamine--glycine ligase
MAEIAECVAGISVEDIAGIVKKAKELAIDLVAVGPEVPLTLGLVDALENENIKAFGPRKNAAIIEGSKAFSKNLMKKYNIPTAKYEVFTDANLAKEYIKKEGAPIVIKADGLAAGKGVVVAMTQGEALSAIDSVMLDKTFGAAGSSVVVEEFMEGEEASLLAFTDGETILPMIPSQDHKRVFDNDEGPNTGGMGSYAPAPVMTDALIKEATEKILKPTINAMKAEGRKYQGCLYAGLMITKEGSKVVEFNARFGDPETQVVLPLLDSDLAEVMLACVNGNLEKINLSWKNNSAVCVVIASKGYPGSYEKGKVISGLDEAKKAGHLIIHAGTKEENGKILTNGGRVLNVVDIGKNIREARDKAYDGAKLIKFDGAFARSDIAHRALERM